ncbi:MAG: tRNA lysidine(34) synthetase TilS [Bacilli bacterium]
METILKQFFKHHQLDIANKTMVVACSTGVDSMALLTSLLALKKEQSFHVIVAHFNHHKREQSLKEQQFIESYCEREQIACFVGHMRFNESGNFQAIARQKRYEFFTQICQITKAAYLVLAHHADDNVETMMMRLLRGSNLLGYSGMEPVLPFASCMLLRPFLEISKQQIIEYAQANKITYFEDASNNEDYYTRNRLRHHLLPLLQAEQPLYLAKFQAFSETLKGANDLVKEQIALFLKGCQQEDGICFSLQAFRELSDFMKQELLFHLLKDVDLSKAQIDSIIKSLLSPKPNWEQNIKKQKLIRKEYSQITISKPKPLWKGKLKITGLGSYQLNDIITINVKKSDEKMLISSQEIWYNSNMLPLVVRSRIPGDKIKLEGGTKKVSDLLTDLKVPKTTRDNILILEKDQEILAVFGIRKSVKLKEMQNCDIIIEVKNHG